MRCWKSGTACTLVPDTRQDLPSRRQCPYGGRVRVLAGTVAHWHYTISSSPSARAAMATNDEPALRLWEQERGQPATASVALILPGRQWALGTAAAPLVQVELSVQTPGSGGHGPTTTHPDAAEPAVRASCATRLSECDQLAKSFSWRQRLGRARGSAIDVERSLPPTRECAHGPSELLTTDEPACRSQIGERDAWTTASRGRLDGCYLSW